MILGLACALGAALVYGVAAVLQAAGARQVPQAPGLDPMVLLRVLRRPQAVMALVLLMIGFGLHLASVRLLPLFLAQSGIAVSLVVSALLAVVMFGERLNRLEWSAVAAVFAGLMLLTASAGDIGDDGGPWIPAAMLGALVLIALLAWPASRNHSPLGTAVLGLLGGFGYALVGTAARLLPGLTPTALLTSLTTYVLVLSGVLAYSLYTLALQRGAVTLATTPLIVAQTVTPAVLGLVLLGDEVRPGWTAGALVGFCVTVIAASLLVRFEGADMPGGDGADRPAEVPDGDRAS